MFNGKKAILHFITASMLTLPAVAGAQSYYDDDIYYNPDNDKKKEQKVESGSGYQKQNSYYAGNTGYVADYPSADTYVFNSGSTRDVDEYNRRGQFMVSDTIASDSTQLEDFAYTRRIERFYNPDVVTDSGDDDLINYYYSAQPAQNINIYVVNNDPYYWNYTYYPWSWRYGYTWHLGWGIYDPWYWGYDPYWSWSWSWGGPCWYPGYHHHHYPGYWPGGGGHTHAWRPSSPGASRPHNPSYASGSSAGTRRPGTAIGGNSSYRPSVSNGSSATRPGNMGRGRGNQPSTIGVKPGYTPSGSYRPGSSTVRNNSSASGTVNTPIHNTYGGSDPSSTVNRRRSVNQNNNINRSSSNNTYRSSSPSSGGSSVRSGGGSSTRSTGGGGSRGRR